MRSLQFFCIFILYFFSWAVLALGVEVTESDEIDLMKSLIAGAKEKGIKVTEQFHCLSRASGKGSLFRSPLAVQNYLLLAPQIKTRIEKFKASGKQFGPLQRALFYSQIIHETQEFSRLSEVSNRGTRCWRNLKNRKGNACINSLDCIIFDNAQFMNIPGQNFKGTRGFENFRGRGLIHLTGCDTYVSALHFRNTGKWRSYWPVKSLPPRSCPKKACPIGQLGRDCSEENIAEIKKIYKKKYGKELDPINLLNNPGQIGYSCHPKNGNKENPLNDFVVDSSFAFWEGKCTDYTKAIPKALDILKNLGPLKGFSSLGIKEKKARIKQISNNKDVDKAIRMVSKCVNGGYYGIEKRKKWFLKALQCVY